MSELNSQTFGAYARKCWTVLAAVVAVTLIMVGTSYAPVPSRAVSIGLILSAAAVNAFLVAAYLMHLITEKKMIFAVLAFTVVFFTALMGLSIWAAHDVPMPLK
jgi:heme/copper-type cytochrome/quinol oxidase subunit 4